MNNKNWFDILCWGTIISLAIYSTIYGTYKIIETLVK